MDEGGLGGGDPGLAFVGELDVEPLISGFYEVEF